MVLKKKTVNLMAGFLALFFVIYGITAIGFADLSGVLWALLPLGLGIILVIEIGLVHWSEIRKRNAVAIVNALGLMIAGASILNGVILLPFLDFASVTPTLLKTGLGAISGVVAFLAALVLLAQMTFREL